MVWILNTSQHLKTFIDVLSQNFPTAEEANTFVRQFVLSALELLTALGSDSKHDRQPATAIASAENLLEADCLYTIEEQSMNSSEIWR